jgi:stage V sporulation protein B
VRENTFLRGAFILAGAGAITRVLGIFYLIPLPRIIHDEGMGLLQMVRPIYYFAFVISVAGLPVAVSKLVAERAALGDVRGIYRIFRTAVGTMLCLGIGSTLALFAGAGWLANNVLKDPGAYYALVAIAPSVIFLTLIAAFRGFFHGLQYMTPSAVSQVGEQLVRVIATLVFAYLLMPQGVELGAAGASFGSVIGALVGAAVFIGYYLVVRRLLSAPQRKTYPVDSIGSILRQLFALAWPVILGAVLLPIMQIIDTAIVPARLRSAGLTLEEVREWYGYLGMALNMMGIPTVITVALSASLVPAIAEGVILGSKRTVNYRTQEAIRISLLTGLPAAAGMFILATEISYMLFGYPQVGIPLAILAGGSLALGLHQTTAGILQGLGQVALPVRNLLAGACLKLAVSYLLTAIPGFGIRGAAWGTTLGFALPAILNLAALRSLLKVELKVVESFLKPAIAAGVMALAVEGTYSLVYPWAYPLVLSLKGGGADVWANAAATLAAIGVGVITYLLVLLLNGGIKRRDLELMPRYGPVVIRHLERTGFLHR